MTQLAEIFFDSIFAYLYPTISSMLIQALDDLQVEQNPPYSKGVLFVLVRVKYGSYRVSTKLIFRDLTEPIWTILARNDMVYCDKFFARFSVKRIDPSWKLFSELVLEKYPGYVIDQRHMLTNKSDVSINLSELIDLLRSKNIERYHQTKDHFFGPQARYCNTGRNDPSVVYATYPRSGNSFMRKYFENITGIATGSDMVMKFSPNVGLQIAGFKGEGITDERCWIKKSHFPFILPFMQQFSNEIAVICTRNPFDVSPSFFYLCWTCTHNVKWREELIKEPIWPHWRDFQQQCCDAWNKWHNWWVQQAEEGNTPIYFFRFEDLLADTKSELEKLMKFIVGIDGSLEGTVLQARIDDICGQDKNKNQVYKPGIGAANRNMKNYIPDQIELQMDRQEELAHIFGYVDDDSVENGTKFFQYKEQNRHVKESSKKKLNYYKKLNEKAWTLRRQQLKGQQGQIGKKQISLNQWKQEGEMNMVTQMDILNHSALSDLMSFDE